MAASTPEKAFGPSVPAVVILALRDDSFRVIAENVVPKLVFERTPALLIVLTAFAAKCLPVENSCPNCVFEFFDSLAVQSLYIRKRPHGACLLLGRPCWTAADLIGHALLMLTDIV